ncbi:hypothetical protein MPTK1_2g09620 [Marchantia polymorpha subsp. ruderalis]|uniref:Dirigent protein n=1 Tax=Marchantia polymorpha TaxID=3197 RepID=A0A2R6W472_MARPO|nr:hypothetical protein MARPO_0158s0033 [Marchantia polymorpha]BBN01702.1 hypothetical protein Mp_2g09620 [Marchantia polymorpha subsp. ruderalis]|eukprot:PTQ28656.1 hypothetical protein MARPO_0158s0033 [Marchantia polymorpha]
MAEPIQDAAIRIPKCHEVQQDLFGVGFQIYTFNGSSWISTNVSADLFDFKGQKIGFHYFLAEKDFGGGQATWETTNPSSRVTAKAVASVKQVDTIPELLLESTNTTGVIRFGSTSFVQRLFPRRGLPPSVQHAKVGDIYTSDYTALYTFSYKKKSLVQK